MASFDSGGGILFSLVIALIFCVDSHYGQLITIQQTESGALQVVKGFESPWIVRANYTNNQQIDGWIYLDITSNEDYDDDLQAKAAGMAEGYLSRDITNHYYQEFFTNGLCSEGTFCTWMEDKFQENLDWMNEMIQTHEKNDYWNMIRLFLAQLDGLSEGYKTSNPTTNANDFNLKYGFWFINFLADIDMYVKIHAAENPDNKDPDSVAFPSCSVLIKKTADNTFVSHTTWHEYRAMEFRFLKKYDLRYHLADGHLIPGQKISFSSYPGTIFSLDDFYSISSGLVTVETTLDMFKTQLIEKIKPNGQIFEPIRVMLSNRLAREGSDWPKLFKRFNSGTYNNQWMIVDYNKIRSGSDKGILHVAEQVPGNIKHQEWQGYWASYNRAYFNESFSLSGGKEMSEKYGNWFSYDNTPRANIFRDEHHKVKDFDTLYNLMRSNNYASSPYNTPDGCSGPLPAAAIAARTDLQPSNVNCTWSPFDQMEGRKFYGSLDVKMVDSSGAMSLTFLAESGPTKIVNGEANVFTWDGKSGEGVPKHMPIKKFNFPLVSVEWPNSGSWSSISSSSCLITSIFLVLTLIN